MLAKRDQCTKSNSRHAAVPLAAQYTARTAQHRQARTPRTLLLLGQLHHRLLLVQVAPAARAHLERSHGAPVDTHAALATPHVCTHHTGTQEGPPRPCVDDACGLRTARVGDVVVAGSLEPEPTPIQHRSRKNGHNYQRRPLILHGRSATASHFVECIAGFVLCLCTKWRRDNINCPCDTRAAPAAALLACKLPVFASPTRCLGAAGESGQVRIEQVTGAQSWHPRAAPGCRAAAESCVAPGFPPLLQLRFVRRCALA